MELHWSIENTDGPFAIDIGGIWERALACERNGGTRLRMSPEDLLLHVCVHGSYNHGDFAFGNGLYPIFDVAAIIRRYAGELDWAALVGRAQSWGAARCIFIMLIATERLLAPGVPARVIASLRPPGYDPALSIDALDLMFSAYQVDYRELCPALSYVRCRPGFEGLSLLKRLGQCLVPPLPTLMKLYPRLIRWGRLASVAYARDVLVEAAAIARSDVGVRGMWRRERARLRLLRWLTGSAGLGQGGERRLGQVD